MVRRHAATFHSTLNPDALQHFFSITSISLKIQSKEKNSVHYNVSDAGTLMTGPLRWAWNVLIRRMRVGAELASQFGQHKHCNTLAGSGVELVTSNARRCTGANYVTVT